MATYRCSVKFHAGEYTRDVRNCKNEEEARNAFQQLFMQERGFDYAQFPVSTVYAVIDTND